MPTNKREEIIYALMTVIITVNAFVFYSLYVVNGNALLSSAGTTSILNAINSMGGVYMLGTHLPIWLMIIIEILLAFTCEMLVGSPLSLKITAKKVDMKNSPITEIQTQMTKSTVTVMVPLMSFFASLLFYPYYNGFNIFTLLANWLKLICFNFPFAYFTQLFFIQPSVRYIFKTLMKRN